MKDNIKKLNLIKRLFPMISLFSLVLSSCLSPSQLFSNNTLEKSSVTDIDNNLPNDINSTDDKSQSIVHDLNKEKSLDELMIENYLKTGLVNTEKENIDLSKFKNDLIPILESSKAKKFNNIHIPKYKTIEQEDIAKNILSRTISITANLLWRDNFSTWIRTRNILTTSIGTGWVIGKVNNDENDHSYYVGTNIHVATSFAKLIQQRKMRLRSRLIDFTFSPAPYLDYLTNDLEIPNAKTIDDSSQAILNLNNPQSKRNNNLNYAPFNLDTSFYWAADNLDLRNWEDFNSKEFLDIKENYNAIDFAVLKIDFAPSLRNERDLRIYNLNSTTRNNIQNFIKNLQKIGDMKFAITNPVEDTIGYMAGAPGLNRNYIENLESQKPLDFQKIREYEEKFKQNNGFYNIVVGANKKNFIYLQSNSKSLNLEQVKWNDSFSKLNSLGYSFNVPYLNLLPGSSGSIFVNLKNETQGIYWGITYFTNQKNADSNEVNFDQKTLGQVIALRVKGHYDVIQKNDPKIGFSNNKTKTLCEAIENNAKKFAFC